MNKKPKVVQLSSVHNLFDPRIFHKISKSLVKAGYDVDLIIQHSKDEVIDGINIVALPIASKKLDRPIRIIPRLFLKAIKYPSNTIFHFHDPELIPVGLLLKWFGYRVIYDIHEDTETDIRQKNYLSSSLRHMIGSWVSKIESFVHSRIRTVIAEKYYVERFPEATQILNYPILDWMHEIKVDRAQADSLIYTGSIALDRGAVIHTNILNYVPQERIKKLLLIGKCDTDLFSRLNNSINNDERLEVIGVNTYIEFSEIVDKYKEQCWLAGLAIFPKTPHYEKKYLTKFYEYMAARLPIIYSNFTEWEKFLSPLKVGISVDPESPKEIAEAIDWIMENPEEAKQMGKNGRKAVLEKYNWANEEKKLLKLYAELEKEE